MQLEPNMFVKPVIMKCMLNVCTLLKVNRKESSMTVMAPEILVMYVLANNDYEGPASVEA